jgi:hypothetical protein
MLPQAGNTNERIASHASRADEVAVLVCVFMGLV